MGYYTPYRLITTTSSAKTEFVPLGELKDLAEDRLLIFDEEPMSFAMGNRKLLKKRYDRKIDAVAALIDGYVAYKINREAFD